MNCVVCSVPIANAKRATKKYCSERCRYRARAAAEGRRAWVPPEKRTEAAGYGGTHQRIRKANGPASDFSCVRCGLTAQEWAYDHSDPAPLVDVESGLEYSIDIFRYQPLCRSCHRMFDADVAGRAQCGTEAGYYRHRLLKEATCQDCRDALASAERRRAMARPKPPPKPPLTHCHRGHEFNEENTYLTRDGHRQCRACRRIRKRAARVTDITEYEEDDTSW